MLVKTINKNIFDVFVGQGWDNWGRFLVRYTPEGKQIKQIKGIPYSKKDFEEVEKELNQERSSAADKD